jgi:hypothetical protein
MNEGAAASLPIWGSLSHSLTQKPYTSHLQFELSHLQLQAFLTHNSRRPLKNSTPHIRNLNPHTCNLKHFSFTNEATTLSKHMRDKSPTVKSAWEGNRKTQGETREIINIGAFSSFTLYFFPLFFTHLGFFIAPWVLAELKVRTLSFGTFMDNFIVRLGGAKLLFSTKILILLSNTRKKIILLSLVRITTHWWFFLWCPKHKESSMFSLLLV